MIHLTILFAAVLIFLLGVCPLIAYVKTDQEKTLYLLGVVESPSSDLGPSWSSPGDAYFRIDDNEEDALLYVNAGYSNGIYAPLLFGFHVADLNGVSFIQRSFYLNPGTNSYVSAGQFQQIWWDQPSLSGAKARISIDNVEFATGEWNTHLRANALYSKQIDHFLFTAGARGPVYRFLSNQGSAQANEYNAWHPYGVVEYKIDDTFSLIGGHYMGAPFGGVGFMTDRGTMPLVLTLGSQNEVVVKLGHPFWDI